MNHLQIYRGDDKTWEIQFKDCEGTPIDITGWTVYFTAKEKKADIDADAKIIKEITSHSDPVDGKTLIILVPADTTDLKGNFYYGIRVKKDTGERVTVLTGTLEVLKNVRKTI